MKELAGKVAVVTGAASGMGLAFAHRFAEEGMNVVLADIESEPLAMAEAALKEKGARALAVRTNVMTESDVNRLADTAFSTFGNVHILCNNAGVGGGTMSTPLWNLPDAEWDWVLGVNFTGVLNGIRAFVPRMVENGDHGHVVNTASVAGLITGGAGVPYVVSKHAVVALTELLYKEFKAKGLKLSASVLCPGVINTNILDSERNRPAEFGPAADCSRLTPEEAGIMEMFRTFFKNGIQPEEVARHVVEAIREDTFYILPAQPDVLAMVDARFNDLLARRNPTVQPVA